ncbi:transglycosylase SLT domain-containing protein [Rhodococcoides fascians]|uniref:transglycosylase SLT domain-containing protein n=1 Tax=Rhodococcoides fascians TaxID=1828 RepID=UPI000A797085|nr:transglycosylase SLT domain-containing protein [Rhodococcus fascians]
MERDLARINPELHVPLVADTTNFSREVDTALAAARGHTLDVGLNLDTTGFQARLDQISQSAGFTVDVDLNANFASFQAQLDAAQRTAGGSATVNLDLDTRVAAAELDAFLTSIPSSVSINLGLDTRIAAAELAAFLAAIPRRRTIDVDANTGPVPTPNAGGLNSVSDSADKATRSLKLMSAVKFTAITAGVGALAAEVVGLIGAAGGAVAALGAIGAVGFIGSKGLGDAFSAASDATATAAEDATDAAERQADALQGVADAIDGIDAAQRGVESAERNAITAQKALNDAYRDANRELRDMNDQLKSAELSQEGAAISVARARENLARVRKDPKSSKLDLQEADLAVRTAEQRYAESKNTTSDLRADTSAANSTGIENSDRVQNAKQAVADSQQGVIDANKNVEAAVRDLAKAQRELAEAGESAGAGQDKLAEALAKLSPNARDFFEKVRALGPAWKDLRLEVQNTMFDGLGDSFSTLATNQMPGLKAGMVTIAGGINEGLKSTFAELDSTLTSLVDSGTMDQFTAGVGQAMQGLAPLVGGLTDAFITMGAEVGPSLGPLFASIGDMFRELGPSLGEFGAIFTDSLTDLMPMLGDFIGAIADGMGPVLPVVANLLGALFDAIEPLIPSLSDIIVIVGETLIDTFAALEPAMAPLGEAFAALLEAIAPFLPMAAEVIATLIEALAPALTTVFEAAGPLIEQWMDAMMPVLEDLAPILADVAMQLGEAFAEALKQIAPLLPTLIDSFSRIVLALAPFIPQLIDIGTDLAPILIDVLMILVESVLPPLTEGIEFLATYALPLVIEGVRQFANYWSEKFTDVRNVIDGARDFIGDATDGMREFFTDLGDSVAIIWKGIVGTIAIAVEQIGKLLQKVEIPSWVPKIGGNGTRALGDSMVKWAEANKFAMGGHITGPGGPTDDLVPAWLSNGEYVVNAAMTAKHGDLVEAINEDRIPAFKDGGKVGRTKEAVERGQSAGRGVPGDGGGASTNTYDAPAAGKGGGSAPAAPAPNATPSTVQLGGNGGTIANGASLTTAIQQSMWDAIRTAFPDVILTSGTRYADVGSGFDHHMGGTAIDLDGPNMPDYARWIYGLNSTQPVEELIHWPLSGWSNLDGGQPFDFGASTNAQHEDHVHWAMPAPVTVTDVPAVNGSASGAAAGATSVPSDVAAADWSLNSSTDAITGMGDLSGDSSSSSESTWSGLAGGVADAFVSGMVGDALGVFGISDEMPGAVKAGQMLWDMQKDGQFGGDSNVADSPAGLGAGVGTDPTTGITAPGSTPAPTAPAAPNPFVHVYDPSAGVDQWANVVNAVLDFGGWPASYASKTLAQMKIESGGDPMAVNGWDSNAAAGTPSKGLMQTIQGTYDAFKSPDLLDDIFDPANNIFAAVNYVETDPKFGGRGVHEVWPTVGGYANGGSVWGPGTSTSDSIPAWLSDREFVMNAKSADANRPLLEAMNRDANVVNKMGAQVFRGIRGGAAGSTSNVDNSMVVNLSTPDVDSAFQKAKTLEAQRSLMYIRR